MLSTCDGLLFTWRNAHEKHRGVPAWEIIRKPARGARMKSCPIMEREIEAKAYRL